MSNVSTLVYGNCPIGFACVWNFSWLFVKKGPPFQYLSINFDATSTTSSQDIMLYKPICEKCELKVSSLFWTTLYIIQCMQLIDYISLSLIDVSTISKSWISAAACVNFMKHDIFCQKWRITLNVVYISNIMWIPSNLEDESCKATNTNTLST